MLEKLPKDKYKRNSRNKFESVQSWSLTGHHHKEKKENILPSYSVHLDMLNKNIDSMDIAQYPINCKTKIREQIHIQGLQKSHCHQLSILMTCSS